MEDTLKEMYQGSLSPLEAVLRVDAEIGGITGVVYRKGLTIQTHSRRFSISSRGLKRRHFTKLQEFIALAYDHAKRKRSIFPGEVHISKGLRSKDYAKEFRDYVTELRSKYATAS